MPEDEEAKHESSEVEDQVEYVDNNKAVFDSFIEDGKEENDYIGNPCAKYH